MVTDLYAEIHRILRTDSQLLELMHLNPADVLRVEQRIQKRSQPLNLIEGNLPLISFYASRKGKISRENDLVYHSFIKFNTYTANNVDLALKISKRIGELFRNVISPFENVENFETTLYKEHETPTLMSDVYCFTTVLHFSLSLDGEC